MTVDQSRRKTLLAGLAAGLVSQGSLAQPGLSLGTGPRIVIVGGGAGGATAARHLAVGSAGRLAVTLVEANPLYRSCFFSNHYLGGLRNFESLVHRYDRLDQLGITVISDRAIGVDREARRVKLQRGSVQYDRLVLAPGIAMKENSVPGWTLADTGRMPHGYTGGEQIRTLKAQIEAMEPGAVFGMVVPGGEYRCPPGPYERATAIAYRLKQINPTATIIIADPKPIFSKQGLFREAWKTHYRGMINYNSDIKMEEFRVDPAALTMDLAGERVRLGACNVIPEQSAGEIAHTAGLTDGDWAPVEPVTLRSTLDDNIHVIGDAAAQGDMPKSAFSANSQAKACAESIIGELTDSHHAEPVYRNICWSFLSPANSVRIGATYAPANGKITLKEGFGSRPGESAALRKQTYEDSLAWYDRITKDMFG